MARPRTPARRSATPVRRAARPARGTRAPAPPSAARRTLAFTPVEAQERARLALELIARPGVRAQVERRLSPGVIETLAHERTLLRTDQQQVTAAHSTQLGATGDANRVADEAAAWLTAVRESARKRNAPASARKAVGVGATPDARSRVKFADAVANAVAALHAPATRAALGLLPEDLEAGEALVARLDTADGTTTTTRSARKAKTRNRDAVQKSLEDALRELATAGQQEYWRPTQRATRDEFMALVAEAKRAPRAQATPPATGAASSDPTTH